MLKAYKYRLDPTPEQSLLINKHIGSCRFVYNLALETKQRAYAGMRINLNSFDLTKQLPGLKEECAWLKEINSQSLQQAIHNMDEAFTKFFKGQTDFPKFKKKGSRQSFKIPQSVFIADDKLHIPKFKNGIKLIQHRKCVGEIRQATISRTPTGKYFVSILIDNKRELPKKRAIREITTIGIDLGIKSFMVTSDGGIFDNPAFFKRSLAKLKYTQRRYSKYKGKRTKHKLAVIHEKVASQRKDFLHNISIRLIRESQSIAIEDLNIAGMIKNHNLAQSIGDAGWGEFVRQLEYKAEWYGKNIIRIGRFEPSSKTCSVCGNINKELTLQGREWTCGSCEAVLDRDINAAINIKNFALKNHLSVERRLKNRNELPTLVGVMTSETDIRLG